MTWEDKRSAAHMIWGPVTITAITHIADRGYILFVETEHHRGPLEIYVTEKGRNIRVWRDGKELQ